jgi:hypothetical protein
MIHSSIEEPIPIGVTINRIVVDRLRRLVDEYGIVCTSGSGMDERRRGLDGLLRAVCRTLRIESIEGERYQLIWQNEDLLVRKRSDDATSARGMDEPATLRRGSV